MSTPSPGPIRLLLALAVLFIAPGGRAAAQTSQHVSPAFAKPQTPEAAGDLLLAHGQYLEAIDAYSRAPYDAATLNKIGVAWHHLSAVGRARLNYERALSLEPDFPEALNNLGATWFAQKEYARAVHFYRRALELSPHAAIFAANLGTAYFAEGKYSEGIEAYRNAFSLDAGVFDLDSAYIINGPITDEERAEQDYCIAALFAEMHNDDRAVDFLHKALNAGFNDAKRLRRDPAFAELRPSPDFESLVREIEPK